MKTTAIVQARLGSERLPGKVLKDLCGKPVLEHVVRRLRKASLLDEVIVAIPDAAKDDVLARFCEERGYTLSRGSEQDVLSRYLNAARAHGADIIVRITSDCPLIDPAIVDQVLTAHRKDPVVEYTCNVLERSFPRGVDTEVVSMACLERLDKEARVSLYREHVTNYMHDHRDAFRTRNVLRPGGDRSDLRICIDTQEDFDLVRGVMQGAGEDAGIEAVIDFLDKHPQIARLNAAIRQKPHLMR